MSQFESEFGDADSAKFIADLTKAVGSTGNGGLASGNIKDNDLLSNIPYSTFLFKLDITNEIIKNIYPSGVNVFAGGESASESIKLCDNAITKISSMRSSLGAVQNRLEYAMSNINILAQAAQAMLTQSNQNPQKILSLLQ